MARSQTTYNKKEREKKRRKRKQDKVERRQQRKLEKEQSGKLDFQDQLSYIDENGNLRFETIEKGSNNIVMIIVPSDVPYGQATIYGKGCTATYSDLQMHSYAFYGGAKSCPTTIDQIQTVASNGSGTTADNFLFGENGLSIAKILPQIHILMYLQN